MISKPESLGFKIFSWLFIITIVMFIGFLGQWVIEYHPKLISFFYAPEDQF